MSEDNKSLVKKLIGWLGLSAILGMLLWLCHRLLERALLQGLASFYPTRRFQASSTSDTDWLSLPFSLSVETATLLTVLLVAIGLMFSIWTMRHHLRHHRIDPNMALVVAIGLLVIIMIVLLQAQGGR